MMSDMPFKTAYAASDNNRMAARLFHSLIRQLGKSATNHSLTFIFLHKKGDHSNLTHKYSAHILNTCITMACFEPRKSPALIMLL